MDRIRLNTDLSFMHPTSIPLNNNSSPYAIATRPRHSLSRHMRNPENQPYMREHLSKVDRGRFAHQYTFTPHTVVLDQPDVYCGTAAPMPVAFHVGRTRPCLATNHAASQLGK